MALDTLQTKETLGIIVAKTPEAHEGMGSAIRQLVQKRVQATLAGDGELILEASLQEVTDARNGNLDPIKKRIELYALCAGEVGYDIYALLNLTKNELTLKVVKMPSAFDCIDREKLKKENVVRVERIVDRIIQLYLSINSDNTFFVKKFLESPTLPQKKEMEQLRKVLKVHLTDDHRGTVKKRIENGLRENNVFSINFNRLWTTFELRRRITIHQIVADELGYRLTFSLLEAKDTITVKIHRK